MNFTKSLILLIAALAVATNAQFTNFNVASTTTGNVCETKPQNVLLGSATTPACTSGCGTNIQIFAGAADNQFTFSSFSDTACATLVGTAAPFTCVDDKTPVTTIATYSISCVGTPVTPKPTTPTPTTPTPTTPAPTTATPTPEDSSATTVISSLSVIAVSVIAALL